MPLPCGARLSPIFHLLPAPAMETAPVADASVPTAPLALATAPPLLTTNVPFTSRPTSIGPVTFNLDPPSATFTDPSEDAGPFEMTSEAASIAPPAIASTSPEPPSPRTTAPAVQCEPAPLTITAPLPLRLAPSPPMLLGPLVICPPVSTETTPSAPPRPTFRMPVLVHAEP